MESIPTEILNIESTEPVRATVKWFINKKGYGFAKLESGDDIFIHFKNINGSGYKSLNEGDIIDLHIAKTNRGYTGIDINIIKSVKNPKQLKSRLKKKKSKKQEAPQTQL